MVAASISRHPARKVGSFGEALLGSKGESNIIDMATFPALICVCRLHAYTSVVNPLKIFQRMIPDATRSRPSVFTWEIMYSTLHYSIDTINSLCSNSIV